MSIRILLADDHQITRQGLKSLLDNESDMQVIAEAENGRSAVKLAKELYPEIVIMDVSMPLMDGEEATRRIYAPPLKEWDHRWCLVVLPSGRAEDRRPSTQN